MLTSVLRTLTQLTRTHGSNVSVMLVNTSGLGKMVSAQSGGVGEVDANATGGMYEMDDGEEGIQSAFRAHSGEIFPSLLMRTLDQGIDSHLLVSSIGRVPVVEVIKDRVGGNVGRWCVWEGEV